MDHYQPQRGDVVLVRATVTRIAPVEDEQGKALIAARTASGRKVSFTPDEVEKVVACEVRVGSCVEWWEEARWKTGTVMAIEEAEKEQDRPAKNNLWIKSAETWVRITKRCEDVRRAGLA